MAQISKLNLSIMKQQQSFMLTQENYDYVQSAIESRLNIKHCNDIRDSVIQASITVAEKSIANILEKQVWTDAAKKAFTELVTTATAYAVCEKLNFDTLDLQMRYNSLNEYDSLRSNVNKAVNSIADVVLRSIERNVTISNQINNERNDNNGRIINATESNTRGNGYDSTDREGSIKDLEHRGSRERMVGDGAVGKSAIATAERPSVRNTTEISNMENTADEGNINGQIRNNERNVSEKSLSSDISENGEGKSVASSSGEYSGDSRTGNKGNNSQDGTIRQTVYNSNPGRGLRNEGEPVRNVSGTSRTDDEQHVDKDGSNDIIGNVEYKYIKDKKYIKGNADDILAVAERLQSENISFSGKQNDNTGTITLTVSGNELRERVNGYLKQVISEKEKKFPVGNSETYMDLSDFSKQVDDAINGIIEQFNALKVCDTPDLLIQAGCQQLPMLYTQKHLMDALHEKSNSNPRWHGLTVEQITRVPDLLKEPVMIFDSISPKNSDNSIVVVLNAVDNDNLPLTVNINANGKGTYNLNKISSNFIKSIYDKDSFDNYISRIVENDNLLFWDKEKSQVLFRVSGLQLPRCLNNLSSNVIIHKSKNIVNTFDDNISLNNSNISNNLESEKKTLINLIHEKVSTILFDRLPFNDKSNLPNIIRKMNATDEMDDMVSQVFTDDADVISSNVRTHITNNATIVIDKQDLDIDEEALKQIDDEHFQCKLTYNDDGISLSYFDFSVMYSWEDVIEACVVSAKKWNEAENNRSFEHLDSILSQNTFVSDQMLSREQFIDILSKELAETKYIINAVDDKSKFSYLIENQTIEFLFEAIEDNASKSGFAAIDFNEIFTQMKDNESFRKGIYEDIERNVQQTIEQKKSTPIIESNSPVGNSEQSNDYFKIYQLKNEDKYKHIKFSSYNELKSDNVTLSINDYQLMYEGKLDDIEGNSTEQKLDNIYAMFNTSKPVDFRGHSLSVSDVVTIGQSNIETAYFVDNFGNRNMPEFFIPEKENSINNSPVGNSEQLINSKSDKIELEGHTDTWYVVDTKEYDGKELYLVENEVYGDETEHLIIDENKNVLLDEVFNGFDDYDYYLEVNEPEQNNNVLEYNIPMPDSSIPFDNTNQTALLPISKSKAIELYNANQYVFITNSDGTRKGVNNLNQLLNHNGMFAINESLWQIYYMQNTESYKTLVDKLKETDYFVNTNTFEAILSEQLKSMLENSNDKDFAQFMLDARSKYEIIWEQMHKLIVHDSMHKDNPELPPFDRLRSNHNFTMEQLAYLSKIESDTPFSREALNNESLNEYNRVNEFYFANKLDDVINEVNSYFNTFLKVDTVIDIPEFDIHVDLDNESITLVDEYEWSEPYSDNGGIDTTEIDYNYSKIINELSRQKDGEIANTINAKQIVLEIKDWVQKALESKDNRYIKITEHSTGEVKTIYPSSLFEEPKEAKQDEQLTFDYVPENRINNSADLIGKSVNLDGRKFVVDSHNGSTYDLRDMTFQRSAGFPVFRTVSEEEIKQALRDTTVNEMSEKEKIYAVQKEITSEIYDFTISDNHFNEDGGAKTKYKNNIEAIKLLKQLDNEKRFANPDEQSVLAKYVGWGGIAQAFDANNTQWTNEYTELKQLLSEEEYSNARSSTVNAHFTSPTVIKAIYDGLHNLGFDGGRILEPAMGTGNFFGTMPDDIRNNSSLYGVELDGITGRIAKQLYQSADISITGFENKNFIDNSFDVAVGNVPFGSYKLNDTRYNKENFYIHDYFFAKSLDKVKPGGIVAFVTSKGTLDKQNPDVRKYLAERAELVGAIRLPNNAFKANAGTEVTADIIFLQKRDRPIDITNNTPEWVSLGLTENMLPINQYFVTHPEMVLGNIVEGNKLYGNQSNDTMCMPIEGADLKEQLKQAISNIQGHMNTERINIDTQDDNSIPATPDTSFFSYTIVDDKLYFRADSDTMKPIDNPKIVERGKAMVQLRNTVHELLDLEISNTDNKNSEQIADARTSLNKQYDEFAKKYGRITTNTNKNAFKNDNTYYLLSSLEKYDNEKKYVGKADIFVKNTIKPRIITEHVSSANDALVLSVSEKAKVDFEYMQKLTGKDKNTLISELGEKIYRLPGNQADEVMYVTADEYLTGNIRKKLEMLDNISPDDTYDYSANRKALELALPPLVEAADIDAKLGAAWIPQEYVKDFALEVFSVPYNTSKSLEVSYSEHTDKWNVSGFKNNYYNSEITEIYGIPEMNAYQILEATLNMKPVEVKKLKLDEYGRTVVDADGKPIKEIDKEKTTMAQQKQADIKRAFTNWAFEEPGRREHLTQIFNEKFNSVRLRDYNGDSLNFVGMNPTIQLRSHQKDAIARGLFSGNTLLAHEVGAGKTFEMIAIAMEGKRLGLHNKCMFAVPNSLTEQFAADFRLLYPKANILVATKKDFQKENRKTLMAKIATGDYDAVILGHSQFDRIHLSKDLEMKYLQEELDSLRDALVEMKANSENKRSFSVKQIEQSIKSKETEYKKLQDKTEDDNVISFERLGIDKLFVDESHMYKNLDIHSKMRNVAGLGTRGSGRAFALLSKCKYLNEKTNNKGVVFASGTPVSNSMTELYTIMRYLQADKLKDAGIKTFDNWASIFAECVQSMELKPECDGKFQMKTRIQNYSCVEQLMTMYRECADIKTADMMELERPDYTTENIVVPATRAVKAEMKKISDRAKVIRVGGVLPTEDNMLKLTMDGKKVGLDLRIIDPYASDDPQSKVNTCVKKVTDIYNETAEKNGVQMVFCDLSVPYRDTNPQSYRIYKKDENGDYSIAFSDKLSGKMTHDSLLKKFSSARSLPKNYDSEEYGLLNPDDVIVIHTTDKEGNVTNDACMVEKGGLLRSDVTEAWYDSQGLEKYVSADSKPKFCVYDDIKQKLIANGIPEKEIAFIHDYDKAEDKQRLFSLMNEGKVRVMLGSTGKCGAGMNAQRKMVALHHLDAPARPSDMEQRNGRIIRQGNENKHVNIYRYVTDRTFDAYSYQILENKQKFISQIMTGKVKVKTCEDIDEKALDFGEVKALCAGNPLIKVKIDLETEINTLKIIKAGFDRQKYSLQDKMMHTLPMNIESAEKKVAKITSDINIVKDNKPQINEDGKEFYPVEINSEVYNDKEKAGKALKLAMLSPDVLEGKEVKVGKYRGFELSVLFDKDMTKGFKACLRGEYPHYCALNADPSVNASGNITRLNNIINTFATELQESNEKLESLKNDLAITTERSKEVFPRQQELDDKERELIDVDTQLKSSEISNDTSEIYQGLEELFPQVMNGEKTYIDMTAGECFDKLFAEQVSDNQIAVAHTYVQNGDLMYSPMITFEFDKEKHTATSVAYEDSSLGGTYEVYDENTKQKQDDCNDFALQWFDNIKNQGYQVVEEKQENEQNQVRNEQFDR